jgi:hypothetical protein
VVINNQQQLPGVGHLRGSSGYSLDAVPFIEALGGGLEVEDEFTVILTLEGKRILFGWKGDRSDFDHHLETGLSYLGDKLQIYGTDLNRLFPLVYPNGSALRKDNKIYINTK